MPPPASMQSFDASALGAFIESAAHARGQASASSALVFVGGFSSWGGVARANVAVYDPATASYLPDATFGLDPFGPSFQPKCAAVYGGKLYLGATNGDVYRHDGPQIYTRIYDAATGPCQDLVEWNGYLVIGTSQEYPQLWDGASITPLDMSGDLPDTFGLVIEGLAVVGSRLCMLLCTDDGSFFTQFVVWTDDGVSFSWLPAAPGSFPYLNFGNGGLPSTRRRWVERDGVFYFYRNYSPDGTGAGNNLQGQVQRFDAAAGTLAAWNAPNPPFITNEYPRFDYNGSTSNHQASAAEIGGRLVLVGGQIRFSSDGTTFAACDRSVELLGTYGLGNSIGQVGGFLSQSAEIFQAHTDRIFVGFRASGATGQVTQLGGGLISGGASLRLATFDGSAWAAWPEQPNSNVNGVFEVSALPS